ncbi:MAG: M28 family metallopeptidase [Gemmatimonadota bacterium]
MRVITAILLTFILYATSSAQTPASYADVANRITRAALADSFAYNRIAELTDRFGPRLSGSENLERAIDWMIVQMKRDGLDHVRGDPVMVPHWVRGNESIELLSPRAAKIAMLGLGGSIATPPEGITAEVLVVTSFDDLTRRAAEAKGKILLFDVPFTSYGQAVQYRVNGAIAAARAGAVASMIRSVSSFSMRNPHTGSMSYDTAVARIPHAAISVEDAMILHRLQRLGERVVVRIRMDAQTLPDAQSRNVIAELRGRERPGEIVVMGGHIDSWDVGTGAMDDAGGVVVAWEAIRLLKKLGLQPRRTIRVVGWTNEENGLRGGNAYRDTHRDDLDKHVLAIESDGGVFKPLGFGFTGSDSAFAMVQRIAPLLEGIGAGAITRGGGGADIGPIMRLGVPGMSLSVVGDRYFWYHHSEADTVDKLDPREVAECVAAMAIMAYVIADLPQPLPRASQTR